VIELLPDEDHSRYRLVAKRFPNGSYAGSCISERGDPVRAHFGELGHRDFLGRWIEDEVEYWFQFAVGRKPMDAQGRKTHDEDESDHVPLTPREREAHEKEARNAAVRRRVKHALAVSGEATKR